MPLTILARPFNSAVLGNLLPILTEIVVAISVALLPFFEVSDTKGSRADLGWVIVALITAAVAINVVVILIASLTAIIRGVDQFRRKEKYAADAPNEGEQYNAGEQNET
jgi:hypothetical protein